VTNIMTAPPATGGSFDYRLAWWAKYGHVDAAVLQAAARLGLLRLLALSPDPVTVPRAARQLGAAALGVRVLLEPLVADGLLTRAGSGFTLAPVLREDSRWQRIETAAAGAAVWFPRARELTAAVRRDTTGSHNILTHLSQVMPADLPGGTGAGQLTCVEVAEDRVTRGYLRAAALMTAGEIGVLDALATVADPGPGLTDTGLTDTELARRCDADPEALGVLLDALVAMGVVAGGPAGRRFTGDAGTVLDARSVQTFVRGLRLSVAFWPALVDLEGTVRSGHRVLNLQDATHSAAFYEDLASYNVRILPRYLGAISDIPDLVAAHLPAGGTRRRVLDIGTGSGVWGVAFARHDQAVEVTYLDQEPVLRRTRRTVGALALADRAWFRPGDLRQDDLGHGEFEVALLGQICHTQPRSALPDLLERVRTALRPGGVLVLADFVLDEERAAPREYLDFAVKEFVSTHGEVLSLPEYTALLEASGLTCVEFVRRPGIDVIVAVRQP